MASRDEETEIAEQSRRAGQYYLALVREGVPPQQAAQITTGWVLGQFKQSEGPIPGL